MTQGKTQYLRGIPVQFHVNSVAEPRGLVPDQGVIGMNTCKQKQGDYTMGQLSVPHYSFCNKRVFKGGGYKGKGR